MPLLKKLRTLAAKVETVVGTPVALAAADGNFNAYDVMIQPNIELERREAPGQFGSIRGVTGAQGGTATFKTDIAWSGTGLPAWAAALLPACGYVESSQVFTPRSEAPGGNVKTLTLGCYLDGKLKQIAGAVGTFKIICPAGKLITIEWEFQGVWQAPTDVALLAPTYPTDKPIRYGAASTTLGGVDQCVENLTFDAGNEIILRECPDTVAGFKSGLIVDREPKITINPEAQLVGTEDRYGIWTSNTEQALSCVLDGPEGGGSNATLTIAAPKAQIANLQEGERNKLVTDEIELDCNKNDTTKDEDVSLTFTDAA